MELRFSQITEQSNRFAFLYNVYALRELPKDELLGHCKDLKVILTYEDSSYVNGLELSDELSVLCMI